jgi:hypothetical protein
MKLEKLNSWSQILVLQMHVQATRKSGRERRKAPYRMQQQEMRKTQGSMQMMRGHPMTLASGDMLEYGRSSKCQRPKQEYVVQIEMQMMKESKEVVPPKIPLTPMLP